MTRQMSLSLSLSSLSRNCSYTSWGISPCVGCCLCVCVCGQTDLTSVFCCVASDDAKRRGYSTGGVVQKQRYTKKKGRVTYDEGAGQLMMRKDGVDEASKKCSITYKLRCSKLKEIAPATCIVRYSRYSSTCLQCVSRQNPLFHIVVMT